jgi:rod shape-determining protein MreC
VPLGTLDRTPPPFFKQGPSALSKLAVCSALALFLIVADLRFAVMQPVHATMATVLYPLQWLVMRPAIVMRSAGQYFESLERAQTSRQASEYRLTQQAQQALQVNSLALENDRLRKLLELRPRIGSVAMSAEVLYDAADPFTRKVIIDRGGQHDIEVGSAVIDEHGVLGQVTRVNPLVSEVTLLTDRDHAIPVLNTRTGARGVAYGEPMVQGGALEWRFMAANADVQAGDLLSTSGVDGVYPAGLPVARVNTVDRRADSAFARITCLPLALMSGARHVMVLSPIASQVPARMAPELASAPNKKAGAKAARAAQATAQGPSAPTPPSHSPVQEQRP